MEKAKAAALTEISAPVTRLTGENFSSVASISLIEPGPVITEFERKVYEEGLKTDLSKADAVTADMFTNIYLKNYKQIFETLGQTADDIAEVS